MSIQKPSQDSKNLDQSSDFGHPAMISCRQTNEDKISYVFIVRTSFEVELLINNVEFLLISWEVIIVKVLRQQLGIDTNSNWQN